MSPKGKTGMGEEMAGGGLEDRWMREKNRRGRLS
jgi:hypothetical protein